MKPEYFIAGKIQSGGVSGRKLAGPVLKVAVGGIILGMVVMILSIAIGTGFKREIREKIVGFGSHIQVVNYDFNLSYEANPIRFNQELYTAIKELDGVKNVQRFAVKPGLLKSEEEMQGAVLKGIGDDYDTDFLESILQLGELPDFAGESPANEIIISATLANILNLQLGQDVFMYFFQEQIRARRYTIVGIYDSNLPDLDKMFVVADLRHIQRLNNWDADQIAGYEVLLNDFDKLDELWYEIYDLTASYISPEGAMLRAQSIRQTQPQIFSWLDLLDMNIAVIIVLILLVAGFNMITGLLILILERTNMIGILKAIGMSDWPLRKIFLSLAVRIAIRGLVWGNLVGIGLAMIQMRFGLVSLDPASYFLDTVPIHIDLSHILLLNAGAILAIFLMMIGPSYVATRITPVKAIHFD
ncbi:ABC transporter permease [Alkalitalea saponilacus]|uniref:Lipoprotein-releasing system permease protein n=1 Tax=Alkalitalea saponilacus TaxID=889453 RepID=A0A1T5HT16_9BACT|nr:FtsX-like permease family protein [Alkalitalea saponilacus]ASB51054.1 ABC transporter permease [Alkalitalea saponilacus]SKC23833.1 lipoprotein-releasing system permease protein [Alkalitalea saponilacus]